MSILLVTALCLTSCAALTVQLGNEMAPQISTEVAMQVGTAIAELPASAPQQGISDAPAPQTSFDCKPKTCGKMNDCAEAVYKLTMCGYGNLDGNSDGVPCQSICSETKVKEILATTSWSVPIEPESSADSGEEIGPVTRVVDGDTIDVRINGVNVRIRYLQMNTPERDHPCYSEATEANADLVAGKTVRLVPDKELVDRYDRLLRFIYVDDVLVNRVLVEQGFAEVVLYPPNDAHYDEFVKLEQEAAAAGRGCHPTGIFDDGSTTR